MSEILLICVHLYTAMEPKFEVISEKFNVARIFMSSSHDENSDDDVVMMMIVI